MDSSFGRLRWPLLLLLVHLVGCGSGDDDDVSDDDVSDDDTGDDDTGDDDTGDDDTGDDDTGDDDTGDDDTGDDDTGDDDDSAATEVIGSGGGTVASDGAVVEVPSGALAADTEVGVEVVEDLVTAGLPAPPAWAQPGVAEGLVLTPHGTTFTTPVTVTIPWSGPTEGVVLLYLDDEQDTD